MWDYIPQANISYAASKGELFFIVSLYSVVLSNIFPSIASCNVATYVQRSEKWLVRGWVKFIPALA